MNGCLNGCMDGWAGGWMHWAFGVSMLGSLVAKKHSMFFVVLFCLVRQTKKNAKHTPTWNGKKHGRGTVQKRKHHDKTHKHGKKTVHKPTHALEHLVKGVCPYRADGNDCNMGPGCLPEAAGPKQRQKNGKKRSQNGKKTINKTQYKTRLNT